MTIQFSPDLDKFVATKGSLLEALSGGVLCYYDSPQPSDPSQAPSGNLIAMFTPGGAAFTPAVRGSGTITVSAAPAGSTVDSLAIGGKQVLPAAVSSTGDTSALASAVAAAIFTACLALGLDVSASGPVITLTELPGREGEHKALAVVAAATNATVQTTDIDTGSAGAKSANGLTWAPGTVAGDITIAAGQSWQAVAQSTATAMSFRCYGSKGPGDSVYVDGSIGTSGADLLMVPSAGIVAGATQTLNSAILHL